MTVENAKLRVPELDLLRFCAASSVMLYHYRSRDLDHAVDAGLLHQMSELGYLGVTLFFMISGFVILWTASERSASAFVISRVSRLFPSYWVAVLLTSVATSAFALPGPHVTWAQLLANLTMVPHGFGEEYVSGVYWTLVVELKFYVFVLLLIVAGQIKRPEWWLLGWTIATAYCATGWAPGWLGSLIIYPHGSYFIAGCLFFLIRASGATPLRIVVLVACLPLSMYHAFTQRPVFLTEPPAFSAWACPAVVLAFYGLFVVLTLEGWRTVRSGWMITLGALTYPLYLVHETVGRVLSSQLDGVVADPVRVGLQIALALLIAWLMVRAVERPVPSRFARWLRDRYGAARSLLAH